ncbi:MAG: shikimate dehydrogenase [Bacteroidota bacterium]
MKTGKYMLGLIGYPLGHSWSAAWFNEKFRSGGDVKWSYHLFPLKNILEFPSLIREIPGLTGLNVTIPYKEQIIPLLDELDPTALEIGAVNTLRIARTGGKIHTKGYNTDAGGFLQTLTAGTPDDRALILGTGGASKAVAWALKRKNIPFSFVSRAKTGKSILSYHELTEEVVSGHHLIINATPLGMFPDIEKFPTFPYQFLTGNHFLYDLVYNPAETMFLKKGKEMNTGTRNGMEMLVNQAELAWQFFKENR